MRIEYKWQAGEEVNAYADCGLRFGRGKAGKGVGVHNIM
jgi:hypothetical protein